VVAPLLIDVFRVSMSLTTMAVLAFGAVLTMIVVPIPYATLFRTPAPPERAPQRAASAAVETV
jgi:hypothetical protein